MEAKLKVVLNNREAKHLVGILGEESARATERESKPGVASLVRKMKGVMPRIRKDKP